MVLNNGVREVKLIQEPFKLASRESKKEDTVIEFSNGVKIGGKNILFRKLQKNI